MESGNRLFIVDGMALLFRSFYAMSRAGLTSPDGVPVGAVYGFLKIIFKILREQKPTHFAVAWESGGKTFRHERYPEYKANRKETPPEIRPQIPLVQELIRESGLPSFAVAGFEGDDVLGTLATRFQELGEVLIVTSDKDLMQLVNERVRLFSLRSGDNYEIVGRQGVIDYFGVPPEQVIDLLALAGDASDNVPGVSGIGAKKAAALLQEFGSLEALLARVGEVSDKRKREALEAGRADALLSRELVVVCRDIPLPFDESALRFEPQALLKKEGLRRRLEGLRMSSLARTLVEWEQEAHPRQERILDSIFEYASGTPRSDSKPVTRSASKSVSHPDGVDPVSSASTEALWGERRYHIVRDAEALNALCTRISSPDTQVFSFDTETTGLDIIEDIPVGASFSFEHGEAFFVPAHDRFRTSEEPGGPLPADIWSALSRAFLTRKALAVAHNAKFDVHLLRNVGVDVGEAPLACSMVAAWLVDAGAGGYGLDAQSLSLLGLRKIPTSRLIGKEAGRASMLDVPLAELGDYACEDADATLRVWKLLSSRMDELGLSSLFFEMEMPLLRLLADMERTGVHIDASYLETLAGETRDTLTQLEARIFELAGCSFNVASPKQLGNVLFEQLKVHETLGHKGKLAKTSLGYKTDASVLEQFAEHPVVSLVLDYRELSKLLGTYIEVLPKLVKRTTGRIHTEFHQAGTSTGRLSSSGPNLQNIPIRTEFGKRVRRAFCASRPDRILTVADYSQIELRVMAHLAQDPAMIAAFRGGADIHRETAARIHGKDAAAISAAERSAAKAINFGILYGMGPQRLAKEQGIPLAEAKRFIERYFETFSAVKRWFDACRAEAHNSGVVFTLFGRRRPIPELRSPNPAVARSAENAAINAPVQGTAADLMKLGMLAVARKLREGGFATQLLLQVHDEIVLEGPVAEAERVQALVRDALQSVAEFAVPLVAETGQSSNWLEAK